MRNFGKRSKTPLKTIRQNVEAGFDGESENRAVQTAVEERADHSRRWRSWMQINRNAERFSGLENFPELRLVQIFAARVGIDDRALEVERFHGSLAVPSRRRRDFAVQSRQVPQSGRDAFESPQQADR